jgi:hypothetical protein
MSPFQAIFLPVTVGTCNFQKNGDNDRSSSPWRLPVQMPTRRGARSEVCLSPDRVRRVVTILLFAFLLFVLPETVRAQTARQLQARILHI